MPSPTITPMIPVLPVLEDTGEAIQPQPVAEPTGPPAVNEPAPVPDGQPPVAPPQEVDWRWRNELRKIPLGTVDAFGNAIGAPSREALITWTQQGRDLSYHQAKLNEERAAFEQEKRETLLRKQELDQLAADLDARSYQPPQAPGAPGYGTPNPYGYPQGGYPAPIGPYANPPAYPAAGGYMPGAQPQWHPDPAVREQMAFQALLSIPQAVQAATAPVLAEIRADRQAAVRAQLAQTASEQDAQLTGLADAYVQKLKGEGWHLPDDFTGNLLISDCNRLGFSANPNLPWTQALEIAAAQRLWRSGFTLGQAALVSEMDTNREATFHVPPTKPTAVAPTPQLQQRIAAARALGETVTMREALQATR